MISSLVQPVLIPREPASSVTWFASALFSVEYCIFHVSYGGFGLCHPVVDEKVGGADGVPGHTRIPAPPGHYELKKAFLRIIGLYFASRLVMSYDHITALPLRSPLRWRMRKNRQNLGDEA